MFFLLIVRVIVFILIRWMRDSSGVGGLSVGVGYIYRGYFLSVFIFFWFFVFRFLFCGRGFLGVFSFCFFWGFVYSFVLRSGC